MLAPDGATAQKKPAVHGEQGEIARICAAGPWSDIERRRILYRGLDRGSVENPVHIFCARSVRSLGKKGLACSARRICVAFREDDAVANMGVSDAQFRSGKGGRSKTI